MFSMTSLTTGYRALVIGGSGGIGSAISIMLARDPRVASVSTLSRSTNGFDLEDEMSVRRHSDALVAPLHLIVCATGALTIDGSRPEKSIRQIDLSTMMRQFAVNAVGPALVLKHFTPLMANKDRALMVVLSARLGSISDNGLGGLISYRSSKAALNQIVKTASIELLRTHPLYVLAAIHPGTVETPLSAPFSNGHHLSPQEAARSILQVANSLTPEQSGGFFAYDGSQISW